MRSSCDSSRTSYATPLLRLPDSEYTPENGKYIGNCMYYDMNTIDKEAELGIVIGDRNYWSRGVWIRCSGQHNGLSLRADISAAVVTCTP